LEIYSLWNVTFYKERSEIGALENVYILFQIFMGLDATDGVIHEFNNWLNFWHFHVRQWGIFMLDVINFCTIIYI
jgi:hypothetical protein